MQIVDLVGMQISPFQNRMQEEYLNPKLTSFQIMTHAPILSTKGKFRSKNIGFLKFYNW